MLSEKHKILVHYTRVYSCSFLSVNSIIGKEQKIKKKLTSESHIKKVNYQEKLIS
jgi:hypothetical protein